MQMFQSLRQAAIATAATLAFLPLASHAVTATGTAAYSESTTLQGYSAYLTVSAIGGTKASGTTFTLDVASAGVSGSSLTSFSTLASEGLSISSPLLAGKSGALTNFVYDVPSSQLSFSLVMNGAATSTTGAFTAVGPTSVTLDGTGSAAFTLSSLFLNEATASTVLTGLGLGGLVQPATLAAIDFGSMNVKVKVTTAVPEPSTYALMALGLGVAGLVARRRSSQV